MTSLPFKLASELSLPQPIGCHPLLFLPGIHHVMGLGRVTEECLKEGVGCAEVVVQVHELGIAHGWCILCDVEFAEQLPRGGRERRTVSAGGELALSECSGSGTSRGGGGVNYAQERDEKGDEKEWKGRLFTHFSPLSLIQIYYFNR